MTHSGVVSCHGLMTMSSAVASALEAKLYCFNCISNDLASLVKDHGVVNVCPAEHPACHDTVADLHHSVVHAYEKLGLVH